MDVKSLAFIGNASAHDCRGEDVRVSRGIFDKETRRKPLAFAADAAAMGIEGRFGTQNPDGGLADPFRQHRCGFPTGPAPGARTVESVPPSHWVVG